MLRHLLILPLCLWLTLASAVNLDSLWSVWKDSSENDSNRLEALYSYAWDGYLFSQPDSALHFAKLHYNFTKSTSNQKEMVNSLNFQGVISYIKGNLKEALLYYKKSYKLSEKIQFKSGIASSLKYIGLIFYDQKNYSKALEYNEKLLNIGKETNNKTITIDAMIHIGMIYVDQFNYEKALFYYENSLKIQEELNDKNGIASNLINIGIVYHMQKKEKTALIYYNKSLGILKQIGNKQRIAACLSNIGSAHKDLGNFKHSLSYLNEALLLAKKFKSIEYINTISEGLYELYDTTGNYSMALEMLELYMETKDSLSKMDAKEELYRFEIEKEYELKKQADSIQHHHDIAIQQEKTRAKEEELQNEKKMRNTLFGGLGIISLLLVFAINRFLVTRKQKDTIAEQKKVVEEQKELVEEQKKDITDSIQYAENIQRALLPSTEQLSLLPEHFVLFQPKDIVSGDFYWMQHHNDSVYLAACDCTGHGVPGAFMSMIGSSQLDEAVIEKALTKANEIFYEVRKGFINALKQTGETQKDGMDAVLIKWDKKKKLEFAAAYNPFFLIRNGELFETKPDKQPVGFYTGEQKPFTPHELTLEKGDTVYIFSDGYHDQFGGPKDKKFMIKNFKKLLLSIQDKDMNEQKTILEETMTQWKGDTEQVDDILVIGVRF